MEAVVTNVAYLIAGGIRPLNFWGLLQGVGTSKPTVWCIVMGDVPSYWEDLGRFQPQGGPLAGKDAAEQGRDRHMDLSATGCINEVSRAGGGGYICILLPEYVCPGYRHSATTGVNTYIITFHHLFF